VSQEETSEQQKTETERKPTNQELLQEALTVLDDFKVTLRKREARAMKRHDNIMHNLSEIRGNKKHRATQILLGYLRTEAFDSIIFTQQLQELFDLTAFLLEHVLQGAERYAKEVAPEIIKLLEKGQKMARQPAEQADDEGPNGPDTRLFT
jgi:hypothetical protein